MRTQLLSFFLIIGASFLTNALLAEPLTLIENKGQWESPTLFATAFGSTDVYFQKDRIGYMTYESALFAHDEHVDHHTNATFNGHCYQMRFLNSLSQTACKGKYLQEGYHNFFLGNDSSKWAHHVLSYEQLYYENVYKGIDLHYYEKEGQLKYDWIVAAHQNPQQIQVAYEGLNGIELSNGNLILQTSIGNMQELAPIAYQQINGQKVPVPCQFKLNGNVLSYEFMQGYNADYDLIIDPTLIFCTTAGGTSNNYGFTATYDVLENAYGGAEARSLTGFNPTLGAFQITQGGSTDMGIIKFNPTGTSRIYATYIGGNNIDHPLSLVTSSTGEVYIYGHTLSPNFPAVGGYDVTHNGGYDIVVIRLSADASTIRSTFLGGSGNDGYNQISLLSHDDEKGEVFLDDLGNCYVASSTSSSNFPTNRAAYTGGQDGIVAKFPSGLNTLTWATCLGGTANDNLLNVKVTTTGEVYAVGSTQSNNFPIVNGTVSGVLSTTQIGGAYDGVVVRLSSTGNLNRSAYFGTTGSDYGYFMDLEGSTGVYIMGITSSTTTFPITGSPTPYSGTGRNIVCKFNMDLSSTLISTRFGGSVNLTAFMVDICGGVYACGAGSGFPVAGVSMGGSGFNLVVFTSNLQTLTYGSTFGCGSHVDGGTSRFDKNGVIYEAICSNSCTTTTPGAYSNSTSGGYNLVVYKASLNLIGMTVDYTLSPNGGVGCAPFTVNFQDATNPIFSPTYNWNFGDGSLNSTLANPTHIYTVPGVYNVKLVVYDPLTCDIIDSAFRAVTVHPPLTIDAGPSRFLCPGEASALIATASNNSIALSYSWSPATGLSSTVGQSVVASPSANTVYTLSVTTNVGCNATDTVGLRMSTLQATPTTATPLCNSSVQLNTTTNLATNSNPFVPCGLSNTLCTGAINVTNLGTGTLTLSYPYTGFWHDGRTQMLFLASEMNAAGITGSKNLNSISFQLSSKASTIPYSNFTIKIGCSALTNLSATTWETGLQTVYTGSVTPVMGWNTYNFTQGYIWDGVSNLIIEICFDNTSYTSYDYVYATATTFNSTHYRYLDNSTGCSMTDGTVISTRPNLRFGYCNAATASPALSYSWSPATGLSATNIPNPMASPTSTTNYTLYVSNGICTINAPLTVIYNCPLAVHLWSANVNYKESYYTDLSFSASEGEAGEMFFIYRKYEDETSFHLLDSLPFKKVDEAHFYQDSKLQKIEEKHKIRYQIGLRKLDGQIVLSDPIEVWVHFPEKMEYETYPNPFQENITIRCLNGFPNWEKGQIRIFDALGKELPLQILSQIDRECVVTVPNLAKGNYFLRISNEKGTSQMHSIVKE
ncbi:MAG: PKD domain-containing protein [Bacteroidia bacterium]